MLKILKIILPIILIFSFTPCKVIAQSEMSMSLVPNINNPVSGEAIAVNFSVEPNSEINIATFRLRVSFDSTKLKYNGIYSNFGTDDFKTYLSGNNLTVIYLTSETGVDISASPTDFLELDFKVLSTAGAGATTISAQIDGIGNYDAVELAAPEIGNANLEISMVPAADCNLKSLTAEGYKLTPSFSPSVTQYYATVPSTKSTINISAETNDSEAVAKISRKTLNAAGKTTDIKITVTGSDNKSKKIYTVTVKRNLKDTDSSSDSSSNSSNNESKSSSSTNTNSQGRNSGISLIKNNFNFILFFVIMAICIVIAKIVIKKKKKE
ncbi:MAG: hypothetical protein RUMPE_01063 [Eubacteriales bacterium SKADARSKE-1]|nr:hypothetical protein [Eubacteriales bacterium SKADARSKE-1]